MERNQDEKKEKHLNKALRLAKTYFLFSAYINIAFVFTMHIILALKYIMITNT